MGLLVDWLVTVGPGYTTPTVFRSDTTYYVTGPVYCGAVTLEAAVFKYPASSEGGGSFIQISGAITSKASQYRPVIFTADKDQSIGAYVTSGTPAPGSYYANPALWLPYNSQTISNMRFLYCREAVKFSCARNNSFGVSHSQFVNCLRGIKLEGCGGCGCGGASLTVQNCLMAKVQYPFYSMVGFEHSGVVYQSTIDGTSTPGVGLVTATGAYGTFTFINSIIANVCLRTTGCFNVEGNNNGFWRSPGVQFGTAQVLLADTPSPFQVSGNGGYYLANGCLCRSAGTASVPPALLADLKKRTTSPPVYLPAPSQGVGAPSAMIVSGDMMLSPQVSRYSSGAPDLGYYYDPLDFTAGGVILDGARLTVLRGTAIGLRNDNYITTEGIPPFADYFLVFDLWKGSSFICEAAPENPSTIASVSMVQEGPFVQYPSRTIAFSRQVNRDGMPDVAPGLSFRFTKFCFPYEDYLLATGHAPVWLSDDSAISWSMRDCSVLGGHISFGGPSYRDYETMELIPHDGGGDVSWANNLFDRVHICLSPTGEYPVGTFFGNNLTLGAYNNLFRGGVAAIAPWPEISGNYWAFRDNLFDKVTVEQYVNYPLNHDHNGYWPCATEEFLPDNPPIYDMQKTATLVASTAGTSDPSTDKTLIDTPPYQAGTFGDYYLPTSTLLYNAGSRSPADAGMYHYTFQTSQQKEGDTTGHNVSIGLHYIAANPSTGLPKDSDTPAPDGIPDYVENWHGDGLEDHADETDWKAPSDPGDQVYENVDLDGDGLTGRFELELGKNPLAADNPLQLQAPLAASGLLQIDTALLLPVDSEAAVRIYVNGEEAPCTEVFEEGGAWLVEVDTFGLPNGPCVLQLATSLSSDGEHWDTALGPPLVLPINNTVMISPLTRLFSDRVYIEALANVPAVNYRVEMRDSVGALLTTLSGLVQSGAITDSWDLTDGNGNVVVSGPISATFYLENAGTQTVSAPATFRITRHITGEAFCVAYSGYRFPRSDLLISRHVVNYLRPGEGFEPEDYALLPSGYNVPYSDNPFEWFLPNTPTLRDALADENCGNFYLMAHGGPDRIGPVPDRTIRAPQIAQLLGNRGALGNGIFNNHPYRLVIIDACQSWGIALANAFGIPIFGEETKAVFRQVGLDPCAYVGWTKSTDQPYSADAREAYGRCLNELFENWYYGFTLKECLIAYDTELKDPLNAQYHLNFFDSWKIAGCGDLNTYDR